MSSCDVVTHVSVSRLTAKLFTNLSGGIPGIMQFPAGTSYSSSRRGLGKHYGVHSQVKHPVHFFIMRRLNIFAVAH